MAIDDYAFTTEDVKSRLHGLFDAAKAVDELEFGCTLLRVRGMESAGWDPFGETHQLVEDLMTLVSMDAEVAGWPSAFAGCAG
jgi:hypothetical protein